MILKMHFRSDFNGREIVMPLSLSQKLVLLSDSLRSEPPSNDIAGGLPGLADYQGACGKIQSSEIDRQPRYTGIHGDAV